MEKLDQLIAKRFIIHGNEEEQEGAQGKFTRAGKISTGMETELVPAGKEIIKGTG